MINNSLQESLLIASESDAWRVLAQLLNDTNSTSHIEFDQWPFFDLVVKGERYSSTIPAFLLGKLARLQKELNTGYGKFVHDGDARNIKKYEKEGLELVYEIKKSSTEIKADLTGFLNKMGEALSKPGTQKVAGITLCVLALIISGSITISTISNNNANIEIEKLRLLQKALEVAPNLKDSSKEFQELFKEIISSASGAQSLSIGKQKFNESEITQLSEKSRGRTEKVELNGTYQVTSVRWYRNHYLVEVKLENDDTVRARVLHKEFGPESIDILMKSLTTHQAVKLSLVATKHEDGYANARVVSINT